jgi:hypothetical protein
MLIFAFCVLVAVIGVLTAGIAIGWKVCKVEARREEELALSSRHDLELGYRDGPQPLEVPCDVTRPASDLAGQSLEVQSQDDEETPKRLAS